MKCQWVYGDPASMSDADLDRAKCGRPTNPPGCPWCPEHLMRVFRRPDADPEEGDGPDLALLETA